ncbi:MAG: hypothetical protein KDA88_16880 [Planctomycetaceae bacterium]|nr:hypothetical protein [Planctomycetaceae bacterium]MCB9953543.1 hypothetical protein [Planctomycetaceae bacterium]
MSLGGSELLHAFVNALIHNIPMWFLLLFGLIFFVSKRDERPRAAGFVLLAIIVEGAHMLLSPLLYRVIYGAMMRNMEPGQFMFQIVGAFISLPSVLAYGLLIYAALMPDAAAGGSYRSRRRYDDEDDDRRDR